MMQTVIGPTVCSRSILCSRTRIYNVENLLYIRTCIYIYAIIMNVWFMLYNCKVLEELHVWYVYDWFHRLNVIYIPGTFKSIYIQACIIVYSCTRMMLSTPHMDSVDRIYQ